MGLFSKKFCCNCGNKTHLITRQPLADGEFLCSACQEKCSPYIQFETFKYQISSKDIPSIIEARTERCERCTQFQITNSFLNSQGDGILVDENHGWWVSVSNDGYTKNAQETLIKEKPEVFEINKYQNYKLNLTCFSQSDYQLDSCPLRYNKIPLPRPDFPTCQSFEEINRIYLHIYQSHPYISYIEISDLRDKSLPDIKAAEAGYKLADEILTFFEQHQG